VDQIKMAARKSPPPSWREEWRRRLHFLECSQPLDSHSCSAHLAELSSGSGSNAASRPTHPSPSPRPHKKTRALWSEQANKDKKGTFGGGGRRGGGRGSVYLGDYSCAFCSNHDITLLINGNGNHDILSLTNINAAVRMETTF